MTSSTHWVTSWASAAVVGSSRPRNCRPDDSDAPDACASHESRAAGDDPAAPRSGHEVASRHRPITTTTSPPFTPPCDSSTAQALSTIWIEVTVLTFAAGLGLAAKFDRLNGRVVHHARVPVGRSGRREASLAQKPRAPIGERAVLWEQP